MNTENSKTNEPNNFTNILLTSLILKTLVKIVDWLI